MTAAAIQEHLCGINTTAYQKVIRGNAEIIHNQILVFDFLTTTSNLHVNVNLTALNKAKDTVQFPFQSNSTVKIKNIRHRC